MGTLAEGAAPGSVIDCLERDRGKMGEDSLALQAQLRGDTHDCIPIPLDKAGHMASPDVRDRAGTVILRGALMEEKSDVSRKQAVDPFRRKTGST